MLWDLSKRKSTNVYSVILQFSTRLNTLSHCHYCLSLWATRRTWLEVSEWATALWSRPLEPQLETQLAFLLFTAFQLDTHSSQRTCKKRTIYKAQHCRQKQVDKCKRHWTSGSTHCTSQSIHTSLLNNHIHTNIALCISVSLYLSIPPSFTASLITVSCHIM